MTRLLLQSSVARIAGFEHPRFKPLARERWRTGDYIVARTIDTHGGWMKLETRTGRMIGFEAGDLILGALGDREATLELTGSWRDIGPNGRMHVMTGGGLLGKGRSRSPILGLPPELVYEGHVMVDGAPANMEHYRRRGSTPFDLPTIFIVGSSMSAGKTATACMLVRMLKERGLRVLAAKLSGAARYRDVLSMGDAGADWIADFVDAGLPSTVCPAERFRERTSDLLGYLGALPADVAIVEAGASPLEPYNGAEVKSLLAHCTRMVVLCASDPYAVLGISRAFDFEPDVVSGVCCNTDAARTLVWGLTGLTALGLLEDEARKRLDQIVEERVLSAIPGIKRTSPWWTMPARA